MTTQTDQEAYFTYAHLRSTDNKVFYIGKGKQARIARKTNRNNYWQNVVSKHGFVPIKLAGWKTEQEAFEHEKFLIWCFKDMGYELVNLTDGGEGLSNPSQETRRKLSEAKKGIVFSDEHRRNLSKVRKGVSFSAERRKNMSISAKTHVLKGWETRRKNKGATL